MDQHNLKPCPFCGKKAITYASATYGGKPQIGCEPCNIFLPTPEAWNARVDFKLPSKVSDAVTRVYTHDVSEIEIQAYKYDQHSLSGDNSIITHWLIYEHLKMPKRGGE